MSLDLNIIRTRAEQYANAIGPGGEKAWLAGLLAADVPALFAEVDRLRRQRDEMIAIRDNVHETTAAKLREVRAALAAVEQDHDRLTEHSKTLNTIAFRIAHALGDVVTGDTHVEGDPIELAERLIEDRNDACLQRVTTYGLIGRLADELQDVSEGCCWRGNFAACDNAGCVERRELLAEARTAIATTPDIEVAAEDTTAIQPCQPIGCDNGYHLAGCRFAEIDAAEHSGKEAGPDPNAPPIEAVLHALSDVIMPVEVEGWQLQPDGTYEPVSAPTGPPRCPRCGTLPIGHQGDCEP